MTGTDTERAEGADELLILAVDDRPANLLALERVLHDVKARVVRATSGEEALALSLRHTFALAILDVQMPGMDGYELAEFLLSDPATAATPIIFVSAAYSDEDHQFQGYRAGAVDYLVKPYDPAVLVSKVNVFLELARHRHHLETLVAERTAALRASEARYRTLFESMSQGVVVQDANGKVLDANPAARSLLGGSVAELAERPGGPWTLARVDGSLVPADATPAAVALATGRVVHEPALGLRCGGGAWLEVTATPMYLDGPRGPRYVTSVLANITARRSAEQRLEASEEALRAVFEGLDDGVLVLDAASLLPELANEAFCRLLGEARPLRDDAPFLELLPAEGLASVRTAALAGSSARVTAEDVWFLRTDGESYVDLTLAPLWFRGRASVLAVCRDVTERRRAQRERERLQAELYQAQRMEAIGALAGGVAHDFNNLLSVILGYVGLAIDAEDTSAVTREDLVEVRRAGERSAELTRQLLAFARKQTMSRVPLAVNDLVLGVEKMLRRVLGERIELTLALASPLGVVSADPGQLEQVLLNLAVNARDAMPSGGEVRLTTCDHDATEAPQPGLPAGRYVRLSVTDTGHGMDAAVRARVFEPFFTTKAPDHGTGLGLSTVYGIVTQSEGHVLCTSELGTGTTFDVYLPRVEGAVPLSLAHAKSTVDIRGGDETILVVEDAGPVRSLATRALTAAGYRVLTAIDGLDALRVCETWTAPIPLVVSDVVMPRMGGEELAARLAEVRPESQVLFMSGYTGASLGGIAASGEPRHFLPKPFRVDELLERVRALLDDDGASEGPRQR